MDALQELAGSESTEVVQHYLDGTIEIIHHDPVPSVLKKLMKWGSYQRCGICPMIIPPCHACDLPSAMGSVAPSSYSFGQRVGPTHFIPGKTPLGEEILANWTLDQPPKVPAQLG